MIRFRIMAKLLICIYIYRLICTVPVFVCGLLLLSLRICTYVSHRLVRSLFLCTSVPNQMEKQGHFPRMHMIAYVYSYPACIFSLRLHLAATGGGGLHARGLGISEGQHHHRARRDRRFACPRGGPQSYRTPPTLQGLPPLWCGGEGLG